MGAEVILPRIIEVQRRKWGPPRMWVRAHVRGREDLFGHGRTCREAIGDLIHTHGPELGIRIGWIENTVDAAPKFPRTQPQAGG
jgi:hypothetical protein